MSEEVSKETPQAVKTEEKTKPVEKPKTEEKSKPVEVAKKEEKCSSPPKKEEKCSSPPKKEEKQPQEKENEKPKDAQTKPNAEAAGAVAEAPKLPTLREQFKAFSKFGDTKSDGKHLTLSQSDKWMKQAKVIDKTITTTDTAIHFKKFKQMKILFSDYDKYLQDLAKAKKIEVVTIKTKLRSCGLPGTSGTTAVVKSSAVDRLTDTKKFTGSHKIRVDPKGKESPNAKK